MRYDEALKYLFGLQKHGIKLGLENPGKLLKALGMPKGIFPSAHKTTDHIKDPAQAFAPCRFIHVAGTNGKGSTCAATASIFRAAGFRTGLFTSPHLLSFTERIAVDGVQISRNDVVRLAGEVAETARGKLPDMSPTFFEVVTAMGFLYFRERGVERAVIETGMGGRLDATNVITPAVSVITPVSMDHMEFLGGTLEKIAAEKAGIIKKSVPLVLAPQPEDAMQVIEKQAARMRAKIYVYGKEFSASLKDISASGIRFDYLCTGFEMRDIYFPLPGRFQAVNASVAITAARLAGIEDEEAIRKGLALTELPGRFELLAEKPETRLDGAHNPEAARALAALVKEIYPERKVILVAGIMADKDIRGVLEALLPLAAKTVFTAPAYGRAAAPELLAEFARTLGYAECECVATVQAALTRARALAGPDGLVLVAGSFYTAGEAKEAFAGGGTLAGLRE